MNEFSEESSNPNPTLITEAPVTTGGELQFVASVSHELRGPLHAILGISELLLESKIRADDKRLVSALNREAVSLQLLIDDILDYARASSGQLELAESVFSPTRLVVDLLESSRPSAAEKNITITLEVDPEVPHSVKGDKVRYGQVIRNFVTNAIRYTEQGSIKIKMSVQDDLIVCSVSDTGIGIDPEILETLFEPFRQVTQKSNVGAGLGLAICKQLVELMGGTIEVTSVPNKGSEFSFAVKLEEAEQDIIHEEPAKPILTKSGKILVVEDNPVNQMLAKKQLDLLGLTAEIAPDGETALDLISNEYLFVLMDWNLPGIDGLETTRQIRLNKNINPDLPIIAMTANALTGDKQKCLDAGMNDFLPKPVAMKSLKEVVNKWSSIELVNTSNSATNFESVSEDTLKQLAEDLGSIEVVINLLSTFLEEQETQIEPIQQISLDNEVEVKRAAHTLKSTAALLGADKLAELCERMCNIVFEENDYKPLAKRVEEEAGLVEVAFAKFISENS